MFDTAYRVCEHSKPTFLVHNHIRSIEKVTPTFILLGEFVRTDLRYTWCGISFFLTRGKCKCGTYVIFKLIHRANGVMETYVCLKPYPCTSGNHQSATCGRHLGYTVFIYIPLRMCFINIKFTFP